MHIKKSLRFQKYPVLCRRSLNKLPESAFRIFHPDWQIDNGFFKRPIMLRTQIRIHRWGPEQGFRRYFADGLNQSLVSSVAQARLFLASQELDISRFCNTVMLWYFMFILLLLLESQWWGLCKGCACRPRPF